jgi:hypothetical protein
LIQAQCKIFHSCIDQAKAVANLPATTSVAPTKSTANAALQMRCIFGGAGGRSTSSVGNEPANKKRQNLRRSKGFDNGRRP